MTFSEGPCLRVLDADWCLQSGVVPESRLQVADTIKLEFAKGQHDNPKICAFAILRGTLADAQSLIPSNNPDAGTKRGYQPA